MTDLLPEKTFRAPTFHSPPRCVGVAAGELGPPRDDRVFPRCSRELRRSYDGAATRPEARGAGEAAR